MYVRILNDKTGQYRTIECKAYDYRHLELGETVEGSGAIWLWFPDGFEYPPHGELWYWDMNDEPHQVFLKDAIVYVMNENGKTIDTIHS